MTKGLIGEKPEATVSCWACAGLGYYDGECECQFIEDTCCCSVPTPPICDECKGEGVL